MNKDSLKRLIDVANGKKKADLVLKNGSIVDVCSGKIFKADLAVAEGYIAGFGEYDGKVEVDIEGKYKFFYPRENCYYYAYIYFDDIKGRELIISEFLYRYSKLFPEDIFLSASGYVYTKEDIEKVYCNKDSNWIYYSPDAL